MALLENWTEDQEVWALASMGRGQDSLLLQHLYPCKSINWYLCIACKGKLETIILVGPVKD